MTVQLTLDTPGKLGHHCRTKCALSGYHCGEGNGFAEVVCVVAAVGGGTIVQVSEPESNVASIGAADDEAEVSAAAEASIEDSIEGDDDGVGGEGAGSGDEGGCEDDAGGALLLSWSSVSSSSLSVGEGAASLVAIDQLGGMMGYTKDFVCVRGGTTRPLMIGMGLSFERCCLC